MLAWIGRFEQGRDGHARGLSVLANHFTECSGWWFFLHGIYCFPYVGAGIVCSPSLEGKRTHRQEPNRFETRVTVKL